MPLTNAVASVDYASVGDVKPQNTPGGSYSSAVNITRTINTILKSASWLSLANNVITLSAGTYIIDAAAPGGAIGELKAWIEDTEGTILILGSSAYGNVALYGVFCSNVKGIITLSASTGIVVKFWASSARTATNSLGVPTNTPGQTELYTFVSFVKIA